jgi:hypothetical protein
MTDKLTWKHVLTAQIYGMKTPERLIGKLVTTQLDNGAVSFFYDVPADATKNELAFLQLVSIQIVENLGGEIESMKCEKINMQ